MVNHLELLRNWGKRLGPLLNNCSKGSASQLPQYGILIDEIPALLILPRDNASAYIDSGNGAHGVSTLPCENGISVSSHLTF